jgi:predicted aconitase with swiveling domain
LFSNTVTILVATAPSKPFTPMTSVSGNLGVITWVAPNENGSPITSYKIYVKTKAGTYSQDLINCDGSSVTIVTNTACSIPLLVLQASPFSLT